MVYNRYIMVFLMFPPIILQRCKNIIKVFDVLSVVAFFVSVVTLICRSVLLVSWFSFLALQAYIYELFSSPSTDISLAMQNLTLEVSAVAYRVPDLYSSFSGHAILLKITCQPLFRFISRMSLVCLCRQFLHWRPYQRPPVFASLLCRDVERNV